MSNEFATHTIRPVRIRDCLQASDIAAIARIVSATGFFSAAEQRIAVEIAEEHLAKGAESTYRFLFAEAEQTIAGYSCYGHIDGTQSSFDLYWIAVAPEHQGNGIGHSLIAHTESRIRDLSGNGIYVETASRELYRPTHAFYESCGYQLAARLPAFYAPDDDKLIFFKALPV
jgi:ribosomal protein S18 acetylase RimI-like enzyme